MRVVDCWLSCKPCKEVVAPALDVSSGTFTVSVPTLPSASLTKLFFLWAPVCSKSTPLTPNVYETPETCVRTFSLRTRTCFSPVRIDVFIKCDYFEGFIDDLRHLHQVDFGKLFFKHLDVLGFDGFAVSCQYVIKTAAKLSGI